MRDEVKAQPTGSYFHRSSFILEVEARGGVEPRAFPPDACRFGLEDRCRARGPNVRHASQLVADFQNDSIEGRRQAVKHVGHLIGA